MIVACIDPLVSGLLALVSCVTCGVSVAVALRVRRSRRPCDARDGTAACVRRRGHDGPHEDRRGWRWGYERPGALRRDHL